MRHFLLLTCTIWLISCSQSKKTTQTDILLPVVESKAAPTKKDSVLVQQTVKKDTVAHVVKEITKEEPIVKKNIFNIAIILPFDVDQVPLDYSPFRLDSSKILSESTKMALEFYMGIKTAVENKAPNGLKANFFFLDDVQFSGKSDALLKERPFPDVDLIVGPTYYKGLEKILHFAESNKIPVIFPGNADEQPTSPMLYSALPVEEAQYQQMILNILQKNPGKAIDVIFDQDEVQLSSINKFRNVVSTIQTELQKEIKINEIPFKIGVTDVLPEGNWNFTKDTLPHQVIVVSSKDNFVRYLMGRLVFIKNPLTVYGLSSLAKMKVLDIDDEFKHLLFLSNATPFILSQKDNSFANTFEDTFFKAPTENAYLGYDLGLYIFGLLKEGLSLKDFTESKIPTFAYNFHFYPIKNKTGEIVFYSNKSQGWLQLVNLKFVPVAE